MKTNDNLITAGGGKARIYKKIKARARWKNPAVAEFDPNWLIRFTVGGDTWLETAKKFSVDNGLAAVRKYAKEVLLTRAHLAEQGEIERWRQLRAPQKVVMLDELMRVYESHTVGNAEKHKEGRAVVLLWTRTLGLLESKIPVTNEVWSWENLDAFVRMFQEYYRRGWTKTKKPPVDAWQTLRSELALGKLPAIDMTSELPCNTSIFNVIKAARTMFSSGGRWVRGLALPEMKALLSYKHGLRLPKGHRRLPNEVLLAMRQDLPRLRAEEPKVWAFFQISLWSGARPVQVKEMSQASLARQDDGGILLTVEAKKRGNNVVCPLPASLVEELSGISTADSLIGAATATEADVIHQGLNDWMTSCGATGTLKSYLLRHMRGQELRKHGGLELSAAGLGHTSLAMSEERYTEADKLIPFVTPNLLAEGAA